MNIKDILIGAGSLLLGGGAGFFAGAYYQHKKFEKDMKSMQSDIDELDEHLHDLWSIANEYNRLLIYLAETEDDPRITSDEKLKWIKDNAASGSVNKNIIDEDVVEENKQLSDKYNGKEYGKNIEQEIMDDLGEPDPSVSDYIREMSKFKEKSSIDGTLYNKKEPVDYRNYSKPPLSELAKPYETEHPVDSDEDDYIFLISKDEFDTLLPPHDKQYLSYYEEDDILSDSNDQVVVDFSNYIGEDALGSFGEGPDPDIVYVRNSRLGIDYEITRYPGSYQEIVLGIYDSNNNHKNLRRETDD